jgi:hypothetical protein
MRTDDINQLKSKIKLKSFISSHRIHAPSKKESKTAGLDASATKRRHQE